MSNPYLGQTVQYTSFGTPKGEYDASLRAAIVTQVHPVAFGENLASVGLCVLNPTGIFFQVKVPYSETSKPGHWSLPEGTAKGTQS